MNVCMYVIDELKNYCTDSYENWYIYEFFHGEGLYNMLIDATRHQPPKRRAIGRSTPQARKRRALRASESDEQRALRLENLRVHATETCSSESSDQREVRLETNRLRTNQIRSSERTELRERRLQNVRISTARSRRTLHADLNLSAFHYDKCFYLRLLLINIRGPISFQDLRTVNGQLCATYRQACQELNLLENDAHWDTALADASNTARPQQIRTLFAIIFTTCFSSNPKDLWEKYKDYMSEDILHRLRASNQNPDIQFTPIVYNEALILIEDICLTIANKALVQLGMPASNRPANNLFDRDLQRETHYNFDELGTFVRTNLPHLILEQRIAYDRIMRAITEQSDGLFFIDALGGTGKTFLLSLILATIRSQNNIALAIASSGIAATLLEVSEQRIQH
ncbi:ATP-dependent DNA helicase [Trichonephila clavipes]|nr:ATP-dependent DNA helicase [Trichonephila clavipes]